MNTQRIQRTPFKAGWFVAGVIALILTACPSKPAISSFTATPASLPAGGGKVTLAWLVTGADNLVIDQGVGAVSGNSIQLNVTSSKTFTLTATNSSGASTASAAVTVAAPPPIPSLSLSPSTASASPGDAPISFTATVTNSSGTVNWSLSPASNAGSLSATSGSSVQYTPPASLSSQTSANLTASLSGTNLTSSVTITLNPLQTLFVNSLTGADNNPGSSSKPLKTLAKALSVVKSGMGITLSGTFDTANGETYPENVPDGVTVQGSTASTAVLVGPGTAGGLIMSGNVTLRYLTLKAFGTALYTSSGVQALVGLVFDTDTQALQAAGTAQPSLTDCTDTNGQQGMAAQDSTKVTVSGGTYSLTGTAMSLLGTASVTWSNSTITGNGSSYGFDLSDSSSLKFQNVSLSKFSGGIFTRSNSNAVELSGGSISQVGSGIGIYSQGTLVTNGTTFSGPGGIGVDAEAGTVSLNNSVVRGFSSYGVVVSNVSALRMRNTQVINNSVSSAGVSVGGTSSNVDLGTSSDPGGNTLQGNDVNGNGTNLNLGITSGVVQAVGNTWKANTQGADANGHYSSLLFNCSNGFPNLNFFNYHCSGALQIQF